MRNFSLNIRTSLYEALASEASACKVILSPYVNDKLSHGMGVLYTHGLAEKQNNELEVAACEYIRNCKVDIHATPDGIKATLRRNYYQGNTDKLRADLAAMSTGNIKHTTVTIQDEYALWLADYSKKMSITMSALAIWLIQMSYAVRGAVKSQKTDQKHHAIFDRLNRTRMVMDIDENGKIQTQIAVREKIPDNYDSLVNNQSLLGAAKQSNRRKATRLKEASK